jgi:hypothetical protein
LPIERIGVSGGGILVGPSTEVPYPARERDDGQDSSGSLSMLSGGGITICGGTDTAADTLTECELKLAPNRPAVIGRAEGYPVPYLDPAYKATRLLPGTGQSVLHSGGDGTDTYVSRGHFMLRASAGGIMLVNGVPRCGGGVRPPLNGTWMLYPVRRLLDPGEEFLITSGSAVVLWLPNGAQLRIAAG